MKINNYSRQKNGHYKIRLEDDSYIILHEDVILKYELLLKKEITDDQKDILLEENKKYTVYDEAIKYLSRKMRCISEMKEYLKKKEYSDDLINDVIDLLLKQKYLDDKAYSKSYFNDRISLSKDGPNKIISSLKQKKIKDEYINLARECFSVELEDERIIKLINKAIQSNHNKGKSYLKQKVYSDLINLGYNGNRINIYLYLIDDIDDSDIYKKEYNKLYSKYSKKYSGVELELVIKNKLYQKGLK